MSARIKGGRIVVGSRHHLEKHMGIRFARHERRIERLQEEGKTLLFVGSDKGPVGLIALREEAPAAPSRLRALGVKRLGMITGDRRQKAEALGAELGLDKVYAELPPEGKAAVVEELQAAGCRVAFVGDGVNDGPALAAAAVGIAMPRGADIARATADIVLLDDRLGAVADAREIAAKTMRMIRGSFNAAVGINTGILAGAMLGDRHEADLDRVVAQLALGASSGLVREPAQFLHVPTGADEGAAVLVGDVPQLAPGGAASPRLLGCADAQVLGRWDGAAHPDGRRMRVDITRMQRAHGGCLVCAKKGPAGAA
jgi:cation transport ATPase